MFTVVTMQDARPGGISLKSKQLPTGVCLTYARMDRLVGVVFVSYVAVINSIILDNKLDNNTPGVGLKNDQVHILN